MVYDVSKDIGELLVSKGVISESQCEQLLSKEKKEGGMFEDYVLELGLATSDEILRVISLHCEVPLLPIENFELDAAVVKSIPKEFAIDNVLIILDRIGKVTSVMVRMPPQDEKICEQLQEYCGADIVRFVIGSPQSILAAIEKYYSEK